MRATTSIFRSRRRVRDSAAREAARAERALCGHRGGRIGGRWRHLPARIRRAGGDQRVDAGAARNRHTGVFRRAYAASFSSRGRARRLLSRSFPRERSRSGPCLRGYHRQARRAAGSVSLSDVAVMGARPVTVLWMRFGWTVSCMGWVSRWRGIGCARWLEAAAPTIKTPRARSRPCRRRRADSASHPAPRASAYPVQCRAPGRPRLRRRSIRRSGRPIG